MILKINGDDTCPIKINEYHRNFMKSHNYAGTVNFELIDNGKLEYTIQYIQALYGQEEKIHTIQIYNDNNILIALLCFENCLVHHVSDTITSDAKRTILLTLSFDSLNPIQFSS